jgi:indole-3-glycerol phosphate synthase
MAQDDFLAAMAAASQARVAAARGRRDDASVRAAALATAPPPPLRLDAGGFDVIAEIKRRSPAVGVLAAAADGDIAARARRYAAAGAAAVSVLTEPSRFDGSMDHLREAAAALAGTGAVAMRKDFLVAPRQVFEAREAGAGGVLLILRMLDDAALAAMMASADECGLFVLLEAFDEADLARASRLAPRPAPAPPLLVGLNTRDLRTLEVDVGRLARCRDHLPAAYPAVGESGLETPAAVAEAAALGYDLALVGSALMRSGEPEALIREMLSAARSARPRDRAGSRR